MSNLDNFMSNLNQMKNYQMNLDTVLKNYSNPNHASEFHKRIKEMIVEFEIDLDPEHEVGMRLVSFGQSITFHVQNIGYYNPSLIRFFGQTEDASPVELIQHVSQISFLLMAVKPVAGHQPRRIGFQTEDKEEE